MVNGSSPGPAPAAPGSGQRLPTHPIQLPGVAPPEAAQESPQRGRRLDPAPHGTCSVPPARSASASSMQSPPASADDTRVSILSPAVGPTRRISQVNVAVHQPTQSQVVRQCDRKQQSSISHQTVVVERRFGCGQDRCVVASVGCSSFQGWFSCLKNHYPRSREHFLIPSARRRTHLVGGLGLSPRLWIVVHALTQMTSRFPPRRKRFPPDLASPNELGQVHVGRRLSEIIEKNGFTVNRDKVRLRGQHQRQEVTGVTVNDVTNVPKRYASQIRAMLYAWKQFGLEAAQRDWEEKYDFKDRGPGHYGPRFELVLKGKIEYLGMIKGHESLTYLKFMDQLGDLDPRLAHGRGTPLRLLLRKYRELEADPSSRQRRGYAFEDVMNELFTLCNVAIAKSFTRNDGGEQIDGAFELDGSYYLVECKWREALTRQAEVDAFSGKIGRSGDHTGGLFVSVNGWTDHVLRLTKQNRDKSVFFMDGLDVTAVLSGELAFVDLLREKINALNIRAEPFVSAESILSNRPD